MTRNFLVASMIMSTLISTPAYTQTWESEKPGSRGLPKKQIRDIRSYGLEWPTYVLHPNSISRYNYNNGLWENFADNLSATDDGGENNAFYFDSNGNLWLGRSNGLYFASAETLKSASPRAENKTAIYFSEKDKDHDPGSPPSVSAIFCDRQQKLWIGSYNRGLRCAELKKSPPSSDGHSRSIFVVESCASVTLVNDIVQDKDSGSYSIWIGTLTGLFKFGSDGVSLGTFLVNQQILGLHADEQGRVWAATNNGLYVATNPQNGNFVRVKTPKTCQNFSTNEQRIVDVTQDPTGTIWAAALNKVYRYQNTSDLNPQNWLPEVFPCGKDWPVALTSIKNLSVDLAGLVWVSSNNEQEGLLRFNMIWETIKFSERDDIKIISDRINTLYVSPIDNSLYVGTSSDAAKRDENGGWLAIRFNNICTDNATVSAFYDDSATRHKDSTRFVIVGLPCTTWRSQLATFDGQKTQGILCGNCVGYFVNNYFTSIIKLPNDSLWLAGDNHLWSAQIKDTSKTIEYTRISEALGLRQRQSFNALLLDNNKHVWIGTSDSGLVRYDITRRMVDLRLLNVGNFRSFSVMSLHLDRMNRLWVGTDKGLTRLVQALPTPIWEDISITNDGVGFVFSDQEGNIWFDAVDGVARYNTKIGISTFPSRTKITDNGPAAQVVLSGLSRTEANGKEWLWFGTNSGLSIFRGDRLSPETSIVRPSRTDPSFTFGEQNILKLAQNSLFIEYEGRDDLTPLESLQFSMALTKDGKVLQAMEFSPRRSQELRFTESGKYYFSVQARDQIGNVDSSPAVLVIDANLDAPSVVITQPAPIPKATTWVPGKLIVVGSIKDADLDSFRVEVLHSTVGDTTRLPAPQTQKRAGRGKTLPSLQDDTLAVFEDISRFDEKKIRIRVTAIDTLLHLRRDSVEVRVDATKPVLEILQPQDSTQVGSEVEMSVRFDEKHRLPFVQYFEPGAGDTTKEIFKNKIVRPDTATKEVLTDSIVSFQARISAGLGKHTINFLLSDSAGNSASQSLVVFRVLETVSGDTSVVRASSDSVVQVTLPPGRNPIALQISPLDSTDYFADMRKQGLQPGSIPYRIEPERSFGRSAALQFKLPAATTYSNSLAIFRRDSVVGSIRWRALGGRLSQADNAPVLRTVIDQGGIYLIGSGGNESFQKGKLTCLPRMFSPGRNNPSPFTEVAFTLDRESPVSIHIFNTAGRRVRTLIRDGETMPPGRHPVQWDGRDDGGDRLRSGIYIVVVKTNSFAETKTVVIQN